MMVITFVEPAVRDINTIFSGTAKGRKGVRLRHLRSADKQLPGLDTGIAVTFCVICDRLLY